jgi:hypothetical protein
MTYNIIVKDINILGETLLVINILGETLLVSNIKNNNKNTNKIIQIPTIIINTNINKELLNKSTSNQLFNK